MAFKFGTSASAYGAPGLNGTLVPPMARIHHVLMPRCLSGVASANEAPPHLLLFLVLLFLLLLLLFVVIIVSLYI